jgi:hypothetical protein
MNGQGSGDPPELLEDDGNDSALSLAVGGVEGD